MNKDHKRINIIYLSRTSKLTGPENILIDILHRLDSNKFSPVVILPDPNGPFYKKLYESKIDVLIKRMPFIRVTLNPFLLLWFVIGVFILNIDLFITFKRKKTDIIVCNTIQEAMFAGLPVKVLKRKLIFCFKNILDRSWKKRTRAKFCNIFADGIIGVSEKALKDYTDNTSKSSVDKKIIGVIHDGIDCSKINKKPIDHSIIDRYKTDKDLIILNIGNLTELKGQLLLLEAVNSDKIKDLNLKILIIGDVYHNSELWYKEKIIDFIKKNNLKEKVHMLGFQKDIKSFLATGDLVVHCPIKDDAFPRVILEAFCSGKAVIGTDIGGIPEMIKDGQNGILCKADKDSLADKILYAYNNHDKLDYIGKNAFQSAKVDFCLEKQIIQTERLYKQILLK